MSVTLISPDPDPIHYLKDKGKKVKEGTNGIYELGNGLHNVLRVVGKLLGDPLWQPMNQTGEDLIKAIQVNLDRFCTLFASEDFISDWYVKGANSKEIKDPKFVEIVFKNSGKDQFELRIFPGHFQFKKAYKSGFYGIGKKMIPFLQEWHPLYRHFIKVKKIKEILEHIPSEKLDSFFIGFLYSMDLDSMKGKIQAMKTIVAYKDKFKKATFSELVNKWITKEGEHFANWSDKYTNLKVLNALAAFKTIEEIKNLNIEELNKSLEPDRIQKTIVMAADFDRKEIVKRILEQPDIFEAMCKKPFETVVNFYDDDVSDEDDLHLDESFERESQSNEDISNENNDHSNEPETPFQEQFHKKTTLLHCLAQLGLTEFIQQAITCGADKEGKDQYGNTPLHLSSQRGQINALVKLIELGADKNAKNNFGSTPLHLAAQNDNIEGIAKLIELGADKEAQNQNTYTPLQERAQLIMHGSHPVALIKLIELGANLEARSQYGETALHIAARNGSDEVITQLIELGANINAKNNWGNTPLHSAAETLPSTSHFVDNSSGTLDSIAKLIALGANKEAQNENGDTPLHSAAQMGNVEAIAKLIELGADIGARDNYGNTPLHSAATSGNVDAIAKLIELGADKEARDQSGDTPLHSAAQMGNVEALIKLIELGADKNAQNNRGNTPLFNSIEGKKIEVALKLLELGVDVNAKVRIVGETPKPPST